jgi:hypothetical protein
VYHDTYTEIPLTGMPPDRFGHKMTTNNLTLHQMGVNMAVQKESVTRQDYVLPEVMVDRTMRKFPI